MYLDGGNRQAIYQIIRRYTPLVKSVARRMTSNEQDAEDVYQSTFLILIRSATKIRKAQSLASWLYGVASRTAHQLRKKSARLHSQSETVDMLDDSHSLDPLADLARQLELDHLDRELDQLPESLRIPMIEHYIQGATAPEIARQMELSTAAVEGRLKRARRILRSRLARRGVSMTASIAAMQWFGKQVGASMPDTTTAVTESASLGVEFTGGDTGCDPCFSSQCSDPWADHLCQQLDSVPDWNSLTNFSSRLKPLIESETTMNFRWISHPTAKICLACAATGFFGLLAIGQIPANGFSGPKTIEVGTATPESVGDDSTITIHAQMGAASDEKVLEVFRIANTRAESIMNIVSSTFDLNDMRITNDPSTNSLIAQASNSDLAKLRALIEVLDQSTGAPSQTWQAPTSEPPAWLVQGQSDQANLADMRAKLEIPVKVDYESTALRDVLTDFAEACELSLFIHETEIVDAGLSLDDPVTASLGEIPLREALDTIFDALEFEYCVKNNHIEISTLDSERSRATRFYDLSHLFTNPNATQPIITALEQSVAPNTWVDQGGDNSISVVGSLLVINAPERIHYHIAQFLAELQRTNPANIESLPPSFEGQIGGGFGGGLGGMGGGGLGGQGGGMF